MHTTMNMEIQKPLPPTFRKFFVLVRDGKVLSMDDGEFSWNAEINKPVRGKSAGKLRDSVAHNADRLGMNLAQLFADGATLCCVSKTSQIITYESGRTMQVMTVFPVRDVRKEWGGVHFSDVQARRAANRMAQANPA